MIWGILFKTDQSCKLWKPILANQDGIWKIGQIHVDHMTVEILSTDLRDFWTKSVEYCPKLCFAQMRNYFVGPCLDFFVVPRRSGGLVFLWCSVWLLESVVPLWDSVEMSDSQTVNFAPSDETRLTSDETRLAAWSPCLFWWSGASCHVYSG